MYIVHFLHILNIFYNSQYIYILKDTKYCKRTSFKLAKSLIKFHIILNIGYVGNYIHMIMLIILQRQNMKDKCKF